MSAGLLEKESTGGAIARVGFDYQDAFALLNLPRWLAQSAFSHVVSEAAGDVEVCYFAPGGGFRRVMYEAKDTTLSATKFWDEVARFKALHGSSPTEYVRFALVCRNFNTVTSPLLSKVDRLQGVGRSFPASSPLVVQARRDILDWARANGVEVELAEFAVDRVDFLTFAAEHADAAFTGEMGAHLPRLDLTGSQLGRLRERYKALISRSSYRHVTRRELESEIAEFLGADADRWLAVPTPVRMVGSSSPTEELGLDIEAVNGPARAAATSADWQRVATDLAGVREFLEGATARRCIALDGKERMSLATLLGQTFSATRGFVLEIEHNGKAFRTDEHARRDGAFFGAASIQGQVDGQGAGVACIVFPIAANLEGSLASLGIGDLPRLTLESVQPIDGIGALNLAVAGLNLVGQGVGDAGEQ